MIVTGVAVLAVVAQGLLVVGIWKFAKNLGAYAESQKAMAAALLYTHESNLALHQTNLRVLDELRKLKREVA